MVPGCKRVRRLFHASENGQGPAFCAAGADAGESFDRLRRIEAGDGVNDELLDLIGMMTDIMGGMKEADTHE